MNEIQLLREQLDAEQRHALGVVAACAAAHDPSAGREAGAALAGFTAACTEYLGCVLASFDERDARLAALHAELAPGETARAALGKLRAAGEPRAGWAALAQYLRGPWEARRRTVAALLAAHPRVTDWRTVAGIDADSIARERVLYARVRAALPAGIELP